MPLLWKMWYSYGGKLCHSCESCVLKQVSIDCCNIPLDVNCALFFLSFASETNHCKQLGTAYSLIYCTVIAPCFTFIAYSLLTASLAYIVQSLSTASRVIFILQNHRLFGRLLFFLQNYCPLRHGPLAKERREFDIIESVEISKVTFPPSIPL